LLNLANCDVKEILEHRLDTTSEAPTAWFLVHGQRWVHETSLFNTHENLVTAYWHKQGKYVDNRARALGYDPEDISVMSWVPHRIVDEREETATRAAEYRIQWLGYGGQGKECTWEPKDNFLATEFRAMVEDWQSENKWKGINETKEEEDKGDETQGQEIEEGETEEDDNEEEGTEGDEIKGNGTKGKETGGGETQGEVIEEDETEEESTEEEGTEEDDTEEEGTEADETEEEGEGCQWLPLDDTTL
jgi:hypothetical protein